MLIYGKMWGKVGKSGKYRGIDPRVNQGPIFILFENVIRCIPLYMCI
jgi:hypothetical protein